MKFPVGSDIILGDLIKKKKKRFKIPNTIHNSHPIVPLAIPGTIRPNTVMSLNSAIAQHMIFMSLSLSLYFLIKIGTSGPVDAEKRGSRPKINCKARPIRSAPTSALAWL